ncbi:MAG: hypothetical protein ABW091_05895 [Microbacterium sp.]
MVPTAVFIGPDELHFGEAALALGADAPERLIRDFLPAEGQVGTAVVVAGEEFSSADLYAWMVEAVTARVAHERGAPPAGVWVVVPAEWSEAQLDTLADAFDRDGQSGVDFVAASEALASRYSHLDPSDSALTVIVCDLDGTRLATSIERVSSEEASRPLGVPILAPVLDDGVGSAALDRSAVESVALAMNSAGVDVGDVDAIVLTGVSDRLDEFVRLLADRFGDPIATDPQPALAAALGAALLLEREATAAQPGAPADRPTIAPAALVATAGSSHARHPRTTRSWFRRSPGLVALGVGVAALMGGIAVASAFAIAGVATPPGDTVTPATSEVAEAGPVGDPGARATPAATATPTAQPTPAPTVPPTIAEPVVREVPQTPARPRAVVPAPRAPATVAPAPAAPKPPATTPVQTPVPEQTEEPVPETTEEPVPETTERPAPAESETPAP